MSHLLVAIRIGNLNPNHKYHRMALLMEDKKNKGKKSKAAHLDEAVLNLVDGMSASAANMVIASYNQIPIVIRDAINEFYNAIDGIAEKGGIERAKAALANLDDICEGNAEYDWICKKAKEETNQEIAELYANGGMSV